LSYLLLLYYFFYRKGRKGTQRKNSKEYIAGYHYEVIRGYDIILFNAFPLRAFASFAVHGCIALIDKRAVLVDRFEVRAAEAPHQAGGVIGGDGHGRFLLDECG